jgi:uncharacterized protein YbcI
VQLLRHRAGRGPTQAKSFWAGEDVLLALFEGGYTKAEQTLWERGRPDTALAYRSAVLDALDADLREIVEDAVDRRVTVILSSVHHEPDVTALVFLLEPAGAAAGGDAGGRG